MDFQDIILNEFKTKNEECINEGWFPITPFLAYSTFKKSIFNSLNKNKVLQTFRKMGSGETSAKIKGKALIAKEKIRHDVGITGKDEDNTVYRLTPEQMSVLADITRKYGRNLLTEIHSFRKNVLAPYQVIKKLVKQNKQVSFKDRFGLSYDDFKAALESGRRKIEKRKDYIENAKGKFDKIGEHNSLIDKIKSQIEEIVSGKSELSDSVLNKIYQELQIGDSDLQGYTLAELKTVTDELSRNYSELKSFLSSGEGSIPDEVIEKIKRNIAIRSGELENGSEEETSKTDVDRIVSSVSSKNLKKGDINVAIAKYMLRKEVRDNIKHSDANSYKKMYIEMLKSLIEKLQNRKKDILHSAIEDKLGVEFTEKEKKVWGKLATTQTDYSGDINNYYQKITDESLKDVRHIHKPEELLKAQQEIENEIKRFERKLAKVLSPEDLAKLKKYRLIGNLITIKEMKDPSSLFKSPSDFKEVPPAEEEKGEEKTGETNDGEEENVTENEFVDKLHDLASSKITTIADVTNTKSQLNELIKQMHNQDDGEIVKKYESLIRKIEERKIGGEEEEHSSNEIVDLEKIENHAKSILKKQYNNIEEMKQDKAALERLIEKYKNEDPNAENNMKEIDFLLSQVDRKFESSLEKHFEVK